NALDRIGCALIWPDDAESAKVKRDIIRSNLNCCRYAIGDDEIAVQTIAAGFGYSYWKSRCIGIRYTALFGRFLVDQNHAAVSCIKALTEHCNDAYTD